MSEQTLVEVVTDWGEQIAKLRAALDQVSQRLIDLESELAEVLAAINAFEFKLRAHVKPLISRLEALEAEIAEYLSQLHRSSLGESDDGWTTWSAEEGGAAAAGSFRYWEPIEATQPAHLDKERQAELKRLYRHLARRFHPDLAPDNAQREYRTQLMMAINAAYGAGDLEKLKELALEPDLATPVDAAETEKQLAEALSREIERCQRRIEEVTSELDTLMKHQSAELMHKAERAAAAGQDFMGEIAEQLRRKIRQKLVERDALKSEVESAVAMAGLQGDDFADAMLDISLDHAYDVDVASEFAEWILRRSGRRYDDDILDDSD